MAPDARHIAVGLSYMYEPAFNRAILPLLQSGAVDALEWSFDTVDDHRLLPDWQQDLLHAYADAGRLYGHGVYYSLLTAGSSSRQDDWLQRFERVQDAFPFRHVSEHFGFMSSGSAHDGCPLPLPLTPSTLAAGQHRLAALAKAARCPVGVENLALAFSRDEVLSHGAFLQELVAPTGGFLVLDLHNIFCQSHNFGLDMRQLIQSYPLDRVREIHVSGGSWADAAGSSRSIRRDTHDDRIPAEVLEQLRFAVVNCQNLDVVFVERLGDTLVDEAGEAAFRDEFLQVKTVVAEASAERVVPDWSFTATPAFSNEPETHPELHRQQQAILHALSTATSAPAVKAALLADAALRDWHISDWDLAMIDTAMQLGRRWGIAVDAPPHG